MPKTESVASIFLDKFRGKNFAFCGTFDSIMAEDQLQMYLEALRVNVSRHVDAKTDYLVAGRGSTAEKNKAKTLNKAGAKIGIINESTLVDLLKPDKEECLRLLRSGTNGQFVYHQLSNWMVAAYSMDFERLKGIFNFKGADLSGLSLSGIPFYLADIDGANFSDTTLDYIYKETITGACFARAQLTLSRSTEIDLTDRCDFRGATISGVVFKWKARNCDFSDSILFGIIWINANFENCNFANANMRSVVIKNGNLAGCDLSGADLTGADLMGTDLTGANLSNANLSETNLMLANLSGCNLAGAILNRTVLNGANLTDAAVDDCELFDASVTDESKISKSSKEAIKELEKIQRVHGGNSFKFSMLANVNGFMIGLSVTCSDFSNEWDICAGTTSHNEQYVASHRKFVDAMSHVTRLFNSSSIDVSCFNVTIGEENCELDFKEEIIPVLCRVFGIDPPPIECIRKFEKERSDRYRAIMVDLIKGGKLGVIKWNQNRGLICALVEDTKNLDLSHSDISDAFLINDLEGSSFESSSLQKIYFNFGNLTETTFKNCCISECQFNSTSLIDADFSDSRITKVNFTGAKLTGSRLCCATFDSCNLSHANLVDADLSGATFHGCSWMECAFNENTKFPDGFDIPIDMLWTGKGPTPLLGKMFEHSAAQGPLSFEDLLHKIRKFVDEDRARIKKAISMLKSDSFELYSDLRDDSLTGIVKSQNNLDLVYSCRITTDGVFSCCTQNLRPCGGLKGAPCKHLLVLLLGLAKAGELPPGVAYVWMQASFRKKPQLDKEIMTDIFLRYKAAEQGEIDWRPTETIPEDYFSF